MLQLYVLKQTPVHSQLFTELSPKKYSLMYHNRLQSSIFLTLNVQIYTYCQEILMVCSLLTRRKRRKKGHRKGQQALFFLAWAFIIFNISPLPSERFLTFTFPSRLI